MCAYLAFYFLILRAVSLVTLWMDLEAFYFLILRAVSLVTLWMYLEGNNRTIVASAKYQLIMKECLVQLSRKLIYFNKIVK